MKYLWSTHWTPIFLSISRPVLAWNGNMKIQHCNILQGHNQKRRHVSESVNRYLFCSIRWHLQVPCFVQTTIKHDVKNRIVANPLIWAAAGSECLPLFLENSSIYIFLPRGAVKVWNIFVKGKVFVSLCLSFMLNVVCIHICVLVLFFRCSGGVEVMQVPRSSQWRSQLITSGFGCWTPTNITTLIPPSLPPSLMALWGVVSLSLHCWVCLRSAVTAAAATASLPNDKPGGPLDWLLSDKGPFHHSPEYIDFVEKNRQGFSTRYKIYR